ncbi:GNAT family N-acetyltransferase [Gracilibacillus alcaliphilus]|uniref:GNAT family N-acetyltransferase n=1 Tax=Gracilibacillus alcaliphilus TaxID=1401441 RepID=UPI00195CF095|nr:GNAT family N-acetyltransferase [Gracilibacillus alcaliphilus]MBM7676605.1 ribosomal protein S18 acetylase RimI-like enzyme [Gracilibacillus alcaliphilus]
MQNKIEVKQMRDFDSDVSRKAAEVFVDGYKEELGFFSHDRENVVDAFQKMLNPEVFYLAMLNGEIVGILACSNNKARGLSIDRHTLKKHFGFVKGKLGYHFMKDDFNKRLPYEDDTGYIECVATSVQARGKGVSTALFQHVLHHTSYQRFILEVIDTNKIAYHMYAKLGFIDMERKKERFSFLKNFKERIYMKLEK